MPLLVHDAFGFWLVRRKVDAADYKPIRCGRLRVFALGNQLLAENANK
jgi:hypothetical protein